MADRVVSVDAAHAEHIVTDLAASVGRMVPTSSSEVVTLLAALDYAVRPDTLREFTAKRYVSPPVDGVWDAVAVYCLLAAMESRRRWRPEPLDGSATRHRHKKTAFRVELERLTAEGVNPPIVDLDSHSVEDLLIQLVQTDCRMTREAIFEAVALKLAGLEE